MPPEQLSALVGAAHRVNQERLPVVVGGAGLPPVGRVLSARPARTPSGCSASAPSARSPARTPAGRSPSRPRSSAWRSTPPPSTSSSRCRAATRSSSRATASTCGTSPTTRRSPATTSPWPRRAPYRELVDSFFRPRYDRATPAERRYMHAMADLGDGRRPVGRGRRPSSAHDQPGRVSPQRDGLLTKGLIYAPDRGLLAFTVPAHGGLPARPARSVRDTRRSAHRARRSSPSAAAAWRLGYLSSPSSTTPLLLNDSLYFSIQAGRNSEGDWFREGADEPARRRARPADVAVPDAVEPRRRRQRRLAALRDDAARHRHRRRPRARSGGAWPGPGSGWSRPRSPPSTRTCGSTTRS